MVSTLKVKSRTRLVSHSWHHFQSLMQLQNQRDDKVRRHQSSIMLYVIIFYRDPLICQSSHSDLLQDLMLWRNQALLYVTSCWAVSVDDRSNRNNCPGNIPKWTLENFFMKQTSIYVPYDPGTCRQRNIWNQYSFKAHKTTRYIEACHDQMPVTYDQTFAVEFDAYIQLYTSLLLFRGETG